jgi:hypothetical protein
MTGPGPSTDLRTRYLLGLASEEETQLVEAEFFADDESFDRMNDAEDDLFAAYAAGRIPPAEQAAFRERYLSTPEGQLRLEFARALLRRSNEAVAELEGAAPRRAAAGWPLWAALAACLAAGTTVWLGAQNARLRAEVERLRAAARVSPPPAPPSPSATEAPRAEVQAVRLPARSTTRPMDVALAPGAASIRVEVALTGDEESATFDAVIRRPSRAEVWRQEGLAPERYGAPLVVTVPEKVLAEGDYVLSIEGEPSREGPPDITREYRLRVVRRR